VSPEQLLFTKTHEWVSVQKGPSGSIATVGITAFAIEALTDLVFIELPAVGQKVQPGKPFGEVESVKAVSDLNSPVDGEIVEVNDAVPQDLEILSKDPYGAGWLIKVRLSDQSALAGLMDYRAYQKQCEEGGEE